MPLTKEGKPVLYKPWKNTTTSKNKFWVYVKSDTKKGFKRIGFGLKGMQDFTQLTEILLTTGAPTSFGMPDN